MKNLNEMNLLAVIDEIENVCSCKACSNADRYEDFEMCLDCLDEFHEMMMIEQMNEAMFEAELEEMLAQEVRMNSWNERQKQINNGNIESAWGIDYID